MLIALDDTPFKAELDQARTLRDEAARDYKQARELYDRTVLAKVELENARNKSVRAQVGQTVVSALESRPLVVLAAASEYVARTRVSGSVLERLAPGTAATVIVAGKTYAGKVRALALEPGKGDEHDVTVAFDAVERLRPGQSVKVEFRAN